MAEELHILLLEDLATDAEMTLHALRQEGLRFTTQQVMTEAEFLAGLREPALDLILADYTLPSYDGLSALASAQKERPEVPFIFVSGTLGEETAIDALHQGATDYVLKQRLGRLGPAVRRALREVEERTRRRQAEQEYRDLFEHAQEAIILVDLQGKITGTNQLVEEYGFAREELLGKTLFDFVIADHRARAAADFEVLLGGQPVQGEMKVATPKGVFQVEYRDNPIVRDGRIVGVQALLTDITERKHLESIQTLTRDILEISNRHTLRRPVLEEVVRKIQDFTRCEAVGIRILDDQGCIPYQAYVGFSQDFYEKESPLSIKSDQCICVNVIRGTTNPALSFYTSGGSFFMNGTTRFLATVSEQEKGPTRNACNQQGYESVALIPIRANGDISGLIHVADPRENRVPLDLVRTLEGIALSLGVAVQRILAEEALRESEERFRLLFANSMEAVLLTVPDGRVLAANPAACQMFGRTEKEICHLGREGLVDTSDPRLSLALEERARTGGFRGELTFLRRDGTKFPGEISSLVFKDKKGLSRTTMVIRDITERRRADRLMRTLAAMALQLVELPADADLFRFTGEKVLDLIGVGIVSVHSIHDDTMTIRHVAGANTTLMTLAQRLLGKAIVGMPLKGIHETAQSNLLTGRLTRVEGGLYELFFHTVPRPVCWTLEKALGLVECYSIGIRRPEQLLGNVTILTQKGTALDPGVVEAFVNQVSIAMERRKAEEALRESEERFRQVADCAGEFIWEMDANGLYTYASPVVERILGYRPEEVVGKKCFYDFFCPREREHLKAEALEAFARRESFYRFINFNVHKDGHTVILETSGTPVTDVQGNFIGYRGTGADVTERKSSEQALRQSEERYRGLFENAVLGMYQTTPDGRILMCNPALVHMLGYDTWEDLATRDLEQEGFEPGYPRSHFRECMEAEGRVVGLESAWKRRDGGTLWVRENAKAVRDEAGKVLFYEGTVEDVTARRLVEKTQLFLAQCGWAASGEDFFETLAGHLAASLGMDYVCIDRLESDQLSARTLAVYYDGQFESNVTYALKDTPCGQVVKDGVCCFSKDVRHLFPHDSALQKMKAESYVGTILRDARGVPIGLIAVIGRQPLADLHLVKSILQLVGSRAVGEIERRQAEVSLRESEARLATIFRASPVAIAISRLSDRRLVDFNRSWQDLTGYSRAEALEHTAHELNLWVDPAQRDAIVGEMRARGVTEAEVQLRQKSGECRVVLFSAEFIELAGEPHLLSLASDITERKRAEVTLRESEARFAAAFHASPDLMAITRAADGKILEVNEGYSRMLGYSSEESLGKTTNELAIWADPGDRAKLVAHLASSGQVVGFETSLRRKDGTLITVLDSARTVTIGEETCILSVAHDITERKRGEEALQRASVYNRTLIETSPDPLITIGTDGKITDVNKATEMFTGHTRTELIGTDFSDYFKEPERARAGYTETFARGDVRDYALDLRHRDGRVFHVLYNASVYRDESDRVAGVFAAARDVTLRKRAEEVLQRASAYNRTLIETSPDPLVAIGPDGTITDVNKATEEVTGLLRADLIGSDFSNYFSEPQKAREGYQKVLAEGSIRDYPLAIRHKTGKITDVLYNAAVYRNGKGELQGVFAAARDVTERKHAEEALRESEAKYRDLVEKLNDVIFVVDTEGIITYVSPPVRRLAGYGPEELVGHPFGEIIYPKDLPELTRSFHDTLKNRLEPWEFRYRTKDGRIRWARTSSRLILEGERTLGIHGLFSDITEQKKAEQQLLAYQDSLRELAARLTLAEEQERRRIAVGVHDQIGQRLALVKLALQSLQASTTEHATVRIVDGVCKDIDAIIADTHALTYELSNPVLHEAGFVNAVESWLAEQVHDRHGIEYTFEADPHVGSLDKETSIAIFQIIRELLANVIKHAKAKHVHVSIRKAQDKLEIRVQDSGVGFEPSRVGRPDSRAGGYGLFSIRERLEYFGGSVAIESAPGQGTSICVVVPVRGRRGYRGKETLS